MKEASTFKKQQDKYFSFEQPHLRASIDNYTLKMAKRLANQLNLNSTDKVLEIGCGSGRFTLPLNYLNRDLKITGLDFSKKLITELKQLKLSNVKTLQGDVDEVEKLTREKYNKIIGFFILHHLPNLEESLRILRKTTLKNAVVGFIEPNPLNPLFYPQPFLYKNMSWKEEKGFVKLNQKFLRKTFLEAGYKDVRIENFGFLPPFIVSRGPGLNIDNLLEKIPLKTFLPFQLITAKVK